MMEHSQRPGRTKFNIPKIKKASYKDNLQPLDINNRDVKALVRDLGKTCLDTNYSKEWELVGVSMVHNAKLEDNYMKKRVELKNEGRSAQTLLDQFGFMSHHPEDTMKIVKDGLQTKRLSCNRLGKSEHGVYLSRYFDLTVRNSFVVEGWEDKVIFIFKFFPGKCKALNIKHFDTQSSQLEPTPNYDSHVSSQLPQLSDTFFTQTARSDIYLYEYTDECVPSKYPRQCRPYAILTLRQNMQVEQSLEPSKYLSGPTVKMNVVDSGGVKTTAMKDGNPPAANVDTTALELAPCSESTCQSTSTTTGDPATSSISGLSVSNTAKKTPRSRVHVHSRKNRNQRNDDKLAYFSNDEGDEDEESTATKSNKELADTTADRAVQHTQYLERLALAQNAVHVPYQVRMMDSLQQQLPTIISKQLPNLTDPPLTENQLKPPINTFSPKVTSSNPTPCLSSQDAPRVKSMGPISHSTTPNSTEGFYSESVQRRINAQGYDHKRSSDFTETLQHMPINSLDPRLVKSYSLSTTLETAAPAGQNGPLVAPPFTLPEPVRDPRLLKKLTVPSPTKNVIPDPYLAKLNPDPTRGNREFKKKLTCSEYLKLRTKIKADPKAPSFLGIGGNESEHKNLQDHFVQPVPEVNLLGTQDSWTYANTALETEQRKKTSQNSMNWSLTRKSGISSFEDPNRKMKDIFSLDGLGPKTSSSSTMYTPGFSADKQDLLESSAYHCSTSASLNNCSEGSESWKGKEYPQDPSNINMNQSINQSYVRPVRPKSTIVKKKMLPLPVFNDDGSVSSVLRGFVDGEMREIRLPTSKVSESDKEISVKLNSSVVAKSSEPVDFTDSNTTCKAAEIGKEKVIDRSIQPPTSDSEDGVNVSGVEEDSTFKPEIADISSVSVEQTKPIGDHTGFGQPENASFTESSSDRTLPVSIKGLIRVLSRGLSNISSSMLQDNSEVTNDKENNFKAISETDACATVLNDNDTSLADQIKHLPDVTNLSLETKPKPEPKKSACMTFHEDVVDTRYDDEKGNFKFAIESEDPVSSTFCHNQNETDGQCEYERKLAEQQDVWLPMPDANEPQDIQERGLSGCFDACNSCEPKEDIEIEIADSFNNSRASVPPPLVIIPWLMSDENEPNTDVHQEDKRDVMEGDQRTSLDLKTITLEHGTTDHDGKKTLNVVDVLEKESLTSRLPKYSPPKDVRSALEVCQVSSKGLPHIASSSETHSHTLTQNSLLEEQSNHVPWDSFSSHTGHPLKTELQDFSFDEDVAANVLTLHELGMESYLQALSDMKYQPDAIVVDFKQAVAADYHLSTCKVCHHQLTQEVLNVEGLEGKSSGHKTNLEDERALKQSLSERRYDDINTMGSLKHKERKFCKNTDSNSKVTKTKVEVVDIDSSASEYATSKVKKLCKNIGTIQHSHWALQQMDLHNHSRSVASSYKLEEVCEEASKFEGSWRGQDNLQSTAKFELVLGDLTEVKDTDSSYVSSHDNHSIQSSPCLLIGENTSDSDSDRMLWKNTVSQHLEEESDQKKDSVVNMPTFQEPVLSMDKSETIMLPTSHSDVLDTTKLQKSSFPSKHWDGSPEIKGASGSDSQNKDNLSDEDMLRESWLEETYSHSYSKPHKKNSNLTMQAKIKENLRKTFFKASTNGAVLSPPIAHTMRENLFSANLGTVKHTNDQCPEQNDLLSKDKLDAAFLNIEPAPVIPSSKDEETLNAAVPDKTFITPGHNCPIVKSEQNASKTGNSLGSLANQNNCGMPVVLPETKVAATTEILTSMVAVSQGSFPMFTQREMSSTADTKISLLQPRSEATVDKVNESKILIPRSVRKFGIVERVQPSKSKKEQTDKPLSSSSTGKGTEVEQRNAFSIFDPEILGISSQHDKSEHKSVPKLEKSSESIPSVLSEEKSQADESSILHQNDSSQPESVTISNDSGSTNRECQCEETTMKRENPSCSKWKPVQNVVEIPKSEHRMTDIGFLISGPAFENSPDLNNAHNLPKAKCVKGEEPLQKDALKAEKFINPSPFYPESSDKTALPSSEPPQLMPQNVEHSFLDFHQPEGTALQQQWYTNQPFGDVDYRAGIPVGHRLPSAFLTGPNDPTIGAYHCGDPETGDPAGSFTWSSQYLLPASYQSGWETRERLKIKPTPPVFTLNSPFESCEDKDYRYDSFNKLPVHSGRDAEQLSAHSEDMSYLGQYGSRSQNQNQSYWVGSVPTTSADVSSHLSLPPTTSTVLDLVSPSMPSCEEHAMPPKSQLEPLAWSHVSLQSSTGTQQSLLDSNILPPELCSSPGKSELHKKKCLNILNSFLRSNASDRIMTPDESQSNISSESENQNPSPPLLMPTQCTRQQSQAQLAPDDPAFEKMSNMIKLVGFVPGDHPVINKDSQFFSDIKNALETVKKLSSVTSVDISSIVKSDPDNRCEPVAFSGQEPSDSDLSSCKATKVAKLRNAGTIKLEAELCNPDSVTNDDNLENVFQNFSSEEKMSSYHKDVKPLSDSSPFGHLKLELKSQDYPSPANDSLQENRDLQKSNTDTATKERTPSPEPVPPKDQILFSSPQCSKKVESVSQNQRSLESVQVNPSPSHCQLEERKHVSLHKSCMEDKKKCVTASSISVSEDSVGRNKAESTVQTEMPNSDHTVSHSCGGKEGKSLLETNEDTREVISIRSNLCLHEENANSCVRDSSKIQRISSKSIKNSSKGTCDVTGRNSSHHSKNTTKRLLKKISSSNDRSIHEHCTKNTRSTLKQPSKDQSAPSTSDSESNVDILLSEVPIDVLACARAKILDEIKLLGELGDDALQLECELDNQTEDDSINTDVGELIDSSSVHSVKPAKDTSDSHSVEVIERENNLTDTGSFNHRRRRKKESRFGEWRKYKSFHSKIVSVNKKRKIDQKSNTDNEAVQKFGKDIKAIQKSNKDNQTMQKSYKDSEATQKSHKDNQAMQKSYKDSEATQKSHKDNQAMQKSYKDSEAAQKSNKDSKATTHSSEDPYTCKVAQKPKDVILIVSDSDDDHPLYWNEQKRKTFYKKRRRQDMSHESMSDHSSSSVNKDVIVLDTPPKEKVRVIEKALGNEDHMLSIDLRVQLSRRDAMNTSKRDSVLSDRVNLFDQLSVDSEGDAYKPLHADLKDGFQRSVRNVTLATHIEDKAALQQERENDRRIVVIDSDRTPTREDIIGPSLSCIQSGKIFPFPEEEKITIKINNTQHPCNVSTVTEPHTGITNIKRSSLEKTSLSCVADLEKAENKINIKDKSVSLVGIKSGEELETSQKAHRLDQMDYQAESTYPLGVKLHERGNKSATAKGIRGTPERPGKSKRDDLNITQKVGTEKKSASIGSSNTTVHTNNRSTLRYVRRESKSPNKWTRNSISGHFSRERSRSLSPHYRRVSCSSADVSNNSPHTRIRNRSPRGRMRNRSPNDRMRNPSPNNRMRNHSPFDRKRNRSPSDRMRNPSPNDRMRNSAQSDRMRSRSPRDRMRNSSPCDRMRSRSPRDRMRGHSPSNTVRNCSLYGRISRNPSPYYDRISRSPIDCSGNNSTNDRNGDQSPFYDLVDSSSQSDGSPSPYRYCREGNSSLSHRMRSPPPLYQTQKIGNTYRSQTIQDRRSPASPQHSSRRDIDIDRLSGLGPHSDVSDKRYYRKSGRVDVKKSHFPQAQTKLVSGDSRYVDCTGFSSRHSGESGANSLKDKDVKYTSDLLDALTSTANEDTGAIGSKPELGRGEKKSDFTLKTHQFHSHPKKQSSNIFRPKKTRKLEDSLSDETTDRKIVVCDSDTVLADDMDSLPVFPWNKRKQLHKTGNLSKDVDYDRIDSLHQDYRVSKTFVSFKDMETSHNRNSELTIQSFIGQKFGVIHAHQLFEKLPWPPCTDLTNTKLSEKTRKEMRKTVAEETCKFLNIPKLSFELTHLALGNLSTEKRLEEFTDDQFLLEVNVLKQCQNILLSQQKGATYSKNYSNSSTVPEDEVERIGKRILEVRDELKTCTSNPDKSEKELKLTEEVSFLQKKCEEIIIKLNSSSTAEAEIQLPDELKMSLERFHFSTPNKAMDAPSAVELKAALEQAAGDILELYRSTHLGCPNYPVPQILLLDDERGHLYSQGDCFLVVITPINRKSFQRLFNLKLLIESSHKSEQDIQRFIKERETLLSSHTGFLSKKREKKLRDVCRSFELCQDYLATVVGETGKQQMPVFNTFLQAILWHLNLTRHELAHPTH